MAEDDGERREIKLVSVFYEGKPLVVPGHHLHISIQVVMILHKMQKMIQPLFENFPQKFHDKKGLKLQEVLDIVELYNKVAKPYANAWSGSYNEQTLGNWGVPHCSDEVAEDIVMWAYGMGIARPLDLNNHYKSFSAETYGETNLKQMAKICDEIGIGKKDVFVDLGCGVGQLVCFVAAYSQCKKSVGIEKSDLPYECATRVAGYFKKLMSHFGKKHGKFEISHGDMLDEKYRKLICEEATVIFINNLMFDEKLMFQLKQILQDLKPGTKVITTKPVCDIRRTDLSDRSLGDITALSETHVLTSLVGGVSWTQTAVPFYLTIMRQDKLEKYFEQKKQQNETSSSEETERKPKRRREKEDVESSGGEKRKKTKRRRRHSEDSDDSEDVTMSSTTSEVLEASIVEDSEDVRKDSKAPNAPKDVKVGLTASKASQAIVKDSEDPITDVKKDSEAPEDIVKILKTPEDPPLLQKRETLASLLENQFSPQKASETIVKDSEVVETPESPKIDVESKILEIQARSEASEPVKVGFMTPEVAEIIVKDSDDGKTPDSPIIDVKKAPEGPPPLQKRVTLASLLEAQFSPQKPSESPKIDLESRILEIQMRSEGPDDVIWIQTPESSIFNEKASPETPEDVKILRSIDFDVTMETMTSDDVTNVLSSLEDSEGVVKDSEASGDVTNALKSSEDSESSEVQEIDVKKDSEAPESVDVQAPECPAFDIDVKMDSEAPEVDVNKAPEVDVEKDSEAPEVVVMKAPEVDVKKAPESSVFNVKMDSKAPESVDVTSILMASEAPESTTMTSDDVNSKALENMILKTSEIQEAPDDVTRTLEVQDPEDVTKTPEPPIDTEPSPLVPPPSMVTRMISPIMSLARNYFFPVPKRRESAESTLPNIQEDDATSSTKLHNN